MRISICCGLLTLVAATGLTVAQELPQRQRNTFHFGSPAVAVNLGPPEVHPERTVTFRIRAPKAVEVVLARGTHMDPMTKDANGVWAVTIGPLAPDIYAYRYVVDGASFPPAHLEIPGTPPRFDEFQKVPQGRLHIRTYTSTALEPARRLYVYLPPQYESEPARKFPVLYLRHGAGGDEAD